MNFLLDWFRGCFTTEHISLDECMGQGTLQGALVYCWFGHCHFGRTPSLLSLFHLLIPSLILSLLSVSYSFSSYFFLTPSSCSLFFSALGGRDEKESPQSERGFAFLVFLVRIQVSFSAEPITRSPYMRHAKIPCPARAGAAFPWRGEGCSST